MRALPLILATGRGGSYLESRTRCVRSRWYSLPGVRLLFGVAHAMRALPLVDDAPRNTLYANQASAAA